MMPIIYSHGGLQLMLTQMPIILLPWMPAPLTHADAHIAATWMPATLAHADVHIIVTMDACHFADAGDNLANSTSASSWSATTTPCLLASMHRWIGFLAPTIWGNRGSLRCVMSLLIFLGIAAHLGSSSLVGATI